MAVTITILLMRHGLSCSNVLDGCMTHIENVDQAFQPHIFDAIDRELVDTPFDRAVGYGAAEIKGDDCTLVLERPDQTTAKVRLHDAYRDPKLTDCGVELSQRAGVALRRRYAKPALVMSSTLQRARETAQHVYPDAEVIEAPFLAERAPSNPDIQLDNEPRALDGASLVPDGVARNSSDWGQFLLFLGETVAPRRVGLINRGRPAARSQARWRRRGRRLRRGPRRLPPGGLWFGREAGEQRGAAAAHCDKRRRFEGGAGPLRPGFAGRGGGREERCSTRRVGRRAVRGPVPRRAFFGIRRAVHVPGPWAKAFSFPDEDPPPPKPWYGEL